MIKLKNYWKPTPRKWRKIGDALLATSLYAQTQQTLTGYSHLMQILSVAGLVGKFLTNFFATDDVKK